MIYVKVKSDIHLPKELSYFKERGLISFVEMLFNKEEFVFLIINSKLFKDVEEKKTLWAIIKSHKKTIPLEMREELLKPYGFGENITMFPIELNDWE